MCLCEPLKGWLGIRFIPIKFSGLYMAVYLINLVIVKICGDYGDYLHLQRQNSNKFCIIMSLKSWNTR